MDLNEINKGPLTNTYYNTFNNVLQLLGLATQQKPRVAMLSDCIAQCAAKGVNTPAPLPLIHSAITNCKP